MDLPERLAWADIEGAKFRIGYIAGTVSGEQKWANTRVWGEGGGGQLSKNGGTIRPVKVQSATDLNQEIWLEREDEPPFCLQVQNYNIQVQPGHRLFVILCAGAATEDWKYLAIGNWTTGSLFHRENVVDGLIATHASPKLQWLLYVIGLPAVVAFTAFQLGYWLLALILFPVFSGIGRAFITKVIKRRTALLKEHAVETLRWLDGATAETQPIAAQSAAVPLAAPQ